MSKPDLWDSTGAFEYRILPEDSIDAFFTEERDMLMITRDLGKWWLGETHVMGQSPFETLEEAKEAGDEQIAELYAGQDAKLLAEAGLDPADWRVAYREGLSFERIDGTASLVADIDEMRPGGQRWDAYAKGDDPVATGLHGVPQALAALGLGLVAA